MAAAAANRNVYYDTLTELNDAAQELKDNNFALKSDVANKNLIVKIFSNYQPIETLKPKDGDPIIVITAGCPGVGKSTIAKKQFSDPDRIYTVSMDTLLERNKRFRNATRNLYEKVRKKKILTIENYGRFNTISRKAYDSKKPNFNISNKISKIFDEHYAHLNSLPNSQQRRGTSRNNSPNSASRSRSRSPRGSKNNVTVRQRNRTYVRKGGTITDNLNGIREIGFEFGVANGLNILYDCTLHKNGNKMDSIMKILQKYAHKYTYKIKVLLIEAHKDIIKAAKIIKKRIKRRHFQMLNQGFLRALKPDIDDIKRMIQTNKEGYDTAKQKYTEKAVNPPYVPDDFDFDVIINKPH